VDSLQDLIKWPCELPSTTKEAIVLNATRIQQLGPVTTQGRQLNGVMYIKRGIAGIGFSSEHTNTMNAAIFGTGNWLGASVINHVIRVLANIEQVEPIEIIFFAKDKIEQLAEKDPNIFKWLYYGSLQSQHQWLTAQAVSLHDREVRVIYTLLEIAKYANQVQGSVSAVHASQKQLSIMAGISRPRLNEVLKMLEASGEISVSRGSIHLLDQQSLTERLSKLDVSIIDTGPISSAS